MKNSNKNTETIFITSNRRTARRYEIVDTFEAGIALKGSEIKSIRAHRVDISRAYVRFYRMEAWLVNAHIAHYPPAGIFGTHDPLRSRKLLMHRNEINRAAGRVSQHGLTVIPLEMYIRRHRAKVKIALARGVKEHDMRESIKARDDKREIVAARRRPTVGR